MLPPDTFLLTLYVTVDDFCKLDRAKRYHPGPASSLAQSEIVTLAVYAQWRRFPSERAFYRHAARHLRSAFPGLPERSQFNRLVRHHTEAITAFFLHLAGQLAPEAAAYEVLDGTGVAVRNVRRPGEGWLAGQADVGWSNRLGFYEGFYLLASVTPEGVLSGFGFGPASTKDQTMAETFFAARAQPQARLASVGTRHPDRYVADKGFEGRVRHQHWAQAYGTRVVVAPKQSSQWVRWPRALRRWQASLRQIVETVNHCLHNVFRLDSERPHALEGFRARLAATCALHNFCIWLNRQLGRSSLAFAELIDW
jgi:hypothetical protein